MKLNNLTKEIIIEKEKLNKMIEQNSTIQTEDIMKFSQKLDQMIKKYYNLNGFYSDKKIERKSIDKKASYLY